MSTVKQETSTKCDVCSFGIIMYEVFFERLPHDESEFDSIVALGTRVANGLRPNVPKQTIERVSESEKTFLDLMQQCWVQEAEERPSFDEIYSVFMDVIANSNAK